MLHLMSNFRMYVAILKMQLQPLEKSKKMISPFNINELFFNRNL